MENFINYDLDPSSSDESDGESCDHVNLDVIMDLIMMNLVINLLKDKTVF